MALRLEITAPGAAPREVPLLPGRTEVVAAPREQYRLVGDAGEIPANVRVLRVDDALVVTGLPDAQELSLEEFFRACRPGTDCTLSFAAPGGPDAVVANDSPSLAALTDGSFLLYGPLEPGGAPLGYAGAAAGASPATGGGPPNPWLLALGGLVGVGVLAGAGGGGGDSQAVLGASETVPPTPTPTPTPAPAPAPTPVPAADTTAPTLVVTDSIAAATTNGLVTFTFAFDEPVTGFDAGDVTVSGGTKGALAGGTDGRTWTMVVSPEVGVASGALAVSVAAGAATDAAGNPVGAARAVQGVDTLGPVATIVDDAAGATTNAPVTFTFSFAEPAIGFGAADVSVSGGTPGPLVTLSEGLRYAMAVTPPPGVAAGSIVVDLPAGGVVDALGNPNPAAPTAIQGVDTLAPAQGVFAFAVADNAVPRVGNLVLGEPTNDRTPTLTLTLDAVLGAGETTTILRDGAAVATRDAGQSFTYTDTPLAPGVHVYTATVSDAAGNLRALDLNGVAADTGFYFVVV